MPEEIRIRYPSISWRDLAGMRDKIIHSYFTVDFETVWLVVKEDIPRLKPMVKKVLENLEEIGQDP
ncbi:MAG: HepT-like ribonuclease domain-containing protein [Candidatus Humimicrobiaceae bacterium]